MIKLLAVFAASLVLAYISEHNTKAILASGRRYAIHKDWAYVLLVVILALFAGLRNIVLMTFEETIITFMKQANDIGKTLAEFEVFADATINNDDLARSSSGGGRTPPRMCTLTAHRGA